MWRRGHTGHWRCLPNIPNILVTLSLTSYLVSNILARGDPNSLVWFRIHRSHWEQRLVSEWRCTIERGGRFAGSFWEKFSLKGSIWKMSSLPALGVVLCTWQDRNICSHFPTPWRAITIKERDKMKHNLKPTLLYNLKLNKAIISPSFL